MKGRDVLFSAFNAVDLTTLEVGAKAAAEPARRERAAIFIMVEVEVVGFIWVQRLHALKATVKFKGVKGTG